MQQQESKITRTQADTIRKVLKIDGVRGLFRKFKKERYDEIFGGKKRIYLPISFQQSDVSSEELEQNITYKAINGLAWDLDFKITSYVNGTAVNLETDQPTKIGKIVALAVRKGLVTKVRGQELLNKFNADPIRQAVRKSDFLIAISRHPVDVATMSTNRGWTSCMTLEKPDTGQPGGNAYYITDDINEGTVVAYLIHPDDKNIDRPIARLLIKPFMAFNGRTMSTKDSILYPETQVYGTTPNKDEFRQKVVEWCESIMGKPTGFLYKLNCALYADGQEEDNLNNTDSYLLVNPKLNSDELGDKLLTYVRNAVSNAEKIGPNVKPYLPLYPQTFQYLELGDIRELYNDLRDLKDGDAVMGFLPPKNYNVHKAYQNLVDAVQSPGFFRLKLSPLSKVEAFNELQRVVIHSHESNDVFFNAFIDQLPDLDTAESICRSLLRFPMKLPRYEKHLQSLLHAIDKVLGPEGIDQAIAPVVKEYENAYVNGLFNGIDVPDSIKKYFRVHHDWNEIRPELRKAVEMFDQLKERGTEPEKLLSLFRSFNDKLFTKLPGGIYNKVNRRIFKYFIQRYDLPVPSEEINQT